VPADVTAVLALWEVAAENASRPSDSRLVVDALLRRDPEALLVADVDGEVVGTVVAGWDGWRAHLYRLAVRPDLRGRGIGSALLDAAEHRLRELGAPRFDAMVLEGNALGQRTWRSRGYRRQDDWARWVKPS
jgi:ribosomal protein S18 acetylase RimI-like enzyme